MPRGKMGSLAYLTPPDAERDRERAFQDWLASAPTSFLECRNGRHIKVGLTDKNTDLNIRDGMCYAEESCPRCGVVMTSVYGVHDGSLQSRTRSGYSYPEGYLLPKEATSGTPGTAMSKERRAEIRLELMDRGFRAHGTTLAKAAAADKKRAAGKAAQAAKKAEPPF